MRHCYVVPLVKGDHLHGNLAQYKGYENNLKLSLLTDTGIFRQCGNEVWNL